MKIVRGPAEIVHLNDHLVIDGGFLQGIGNRDDQSRALWLYRRMPASALHGKIKPPGVTLDSIWDFEAINLDR